jgi:hypothetical protein
MTSFQFRKSHSFNSIEREARVGIERRFRPVTVFYDDFQRRIKLNLLLLKLKTTCFYLQFTGDFTGDFGPVNEADMTAFKATTSSQEYCAAAHCTI